MKPIKKKVIHYYYCAECGKPIKSDSQCIYCDECQKKIIDRNNEIMKNRYKEHNYKWVGWEHELKGDNAKNKYDN